jgi:hypothetical protein
MLRGAVRVVNQIRILLHDAIRRTGNMTDYRIVLLLQTFRYMNVHGASDADISNVGILLAAISSHAIVGAFEKELNHRK